MVNHSHKLNDCCSICFAAMFYSLRNEALFCRPVFVERFLLMSVIPALFQSIRKSRPLFGRCAAGRCLWPLEWLHSRFMEDHWTQETVWLYK
ncbi:hypothetical protein CEXT_335001 [Caerostris extrusa]|uniref:Uncharacterized protein n=1 Tax=Caerostris extrusa TaxID=172846 RepID=A0AAV4N7X1_CAEEX|nr:hypothetical protein CEXT_335001 [Caerostris extrusa]